MVHECQFAKGKCLFCGQKEENYWNNEVTKMQQRMAQKTP
jgi:hypothetical protein